MPFPNDSFRHASGIASDARGVCLWALLVVVAHASGASAQGTSPEVRAGGAEGRAHLSYVAPDGCPGFEDWALLLQSRLGYEAAQPPLVGARSLRITVAEEDVFVARLEELIADEWTGLRDVRAGTCDEAAVAMATVVAMSLDPFGEFAQRHREREREELAPDLARLDAEEPPALVGPAPRRIAAPIVETSLAIALSARLSVLDAPVVATGLGVSLLVERDSLAIEFGIAAASTPGYVAAGEHSLYNLATTAEIAGYYSHGVLRAGPFVRAGATLFNVRAAQSIWRPALQGGLRVGLRRRAARVPWHVDVDVGANLLRSQVSFDGAEAWRSSWVFVQLRAGIEIPLSGSH